MRPLLAALAFSHGVTGRVDLMKKLKAADLLGL